MPVVAPPDRVGSGVGVSIEDGDQDGVSLLPLDAEDVVTDVVVELEEVVKDVRSDCWKATVMGCAHIVTEPVTATKYVEVPSRYDVKAELISSSLAKTVVVP